MDQAIETEVYTRRSKRTDGRTDGRTVIDDRLITSSRVKPQMRGKGKGSLLGLASASCQEQSVDELLHFKARRLVAKGEGGTERGKGPFGGAINLSVGQSDCLLRILYLFSIAVRS